MHDYFRHRRFDSKLRLRVSTTFLRIFRKCLHYNSRVVSGTSIVQYLQIIVGPLMVAALILEFSGLQPAAIVALLFAYLDQTEDRDDIRYFWDGTILWSGAIIGLVATWVFMLWLHDPREYPWILGSFFAVEYFVAGSILTVAVLRMHWQLLDRPLRTSKKPATLDRRLVVLFGVLAAVVVSDTTALCFLLLWQLLPLEMLIAVPIGLLIRAAAKQMTVVRFLKVGRFLLLLFAAWTLCKAFAFLTLPVGATEETPIVLTGLYLAVVLFLMWLQRRRDVSTEQTQANA